ncbi:hypothetical protein B0H67DRAFT_580917 [Lasiosphaeris hirsuta]|uniref:RelA/SpoT domain-containing protein n=1 Tax=Lasiosphaeris hirsuta TaxID=260670 RepID=A0AA40AGP7_9PEZI|nr:hypothetical protein B0H67DRAFT_580917 [Lasiosphaeris hirsuta]
MGYRATNFRVGLKPDSTGTRSPREQKKMVEIQVTSVVMHAWADVHHDLIYKPYSGDITDEAFSARGGPRLISGGAGHVRILIFTFINSITLSLSMTNRIPKTIERHLKRESFTRLPDELKQPSQKFIQDGNSNTMCQRFGRGLTAVSRLRLQRLWEEKHMRKYK